MVRRVVRSLACLAFALLAGPALALDPGVDPFADLNRAAREAYGAARARAIPAEQPVFVVLGSVTLLKDGQSWSVPFIPAGYRDMKSLSHIPLGVFAAAAAREQEPDDPQWAKRLAVLKEHAEAALGSLDRTGLTDPQKDRQRAMLVRSIAYVDAALADPRPDPAALKDYARAVAPATLANAADAAGEAVGSLHRAVTELRGRLAPGEWERAYVLVLGPKTAREGNLQYAYFANAMGPGAAGRLIYAESIFDREAALNLLRTLILDRKVGEAFYADPARMERDVLADGAQAALLTLFGRLGP